MANTNPVSTGTGSQVFTKTVNPGNTVTLDEIPTNSFTEIDYLVTIRNTSTQQIKGLKMLVLKTDGSPSTQVYGRSGPNVASVIDANISGLNTNVFVTNNSLSVLEIKYTRQII